MSRFVSLFTGAVALTLALGGCTAATEPAATPEPGAPPVEDFTSAPPVETSATPMGAQSFAYLEGVWVVTAASAEGATGTAADPSGEWEFTVMGESMTVYIGERRYEGLLKGADGGWSYSGMITGTNAQGEPLGGYITLTAADTGEGAFIGTLLQYLDADGATPSSKTPWDIEAIRR